MKNLRAEIEQAINTYKSGNLIKTETITKKLISENPKIGFLYNLLGLTLVRQKRIEEAEIIYKKGIAADPKFAMIYNNLGMLYIKYKSNEEDAEKFYKKAIDIDQNIYEPKTNLGNLYHSINKFKKSIMYHKLAIETNPKIPYSYLNLANVYITIGSFHLAVKQLKEAIKIDYYFYQAHRLLSRIIKYTKKEPHLNQLKELYQKLGNNFSEDKMLLGFALGKAYEDIKDYDQSFKYYKNSNIINKSKNKFFLKIEKEKFSKIKSKFNKDFFKEKRINGYETNKPIFIVGMPRSGTTLVEQIISSHKDVYGADEIELLPKIIDNYFGKNYEKIDSINKVDFNKMGNEYIDEMNRVSEDSIRCTDKLPYNFINIGFIKLMLPKAKIVHCCRNPKDNIFSIFKNYFPGNKISYSSDLSEIVDYYNLYSDLMNKWNLLMPNYIINIKYEDLVLNNKKEVLKILNFCDLNWDDKCLKFYENTRPVKTASDIQVRSKIYKSSINSWKDYKKHLIKFFNKLD